MKFDNPVSFSLFNKIPFNTTLSFVSRVLNANQLQFQIVADQFHGSNLYVTEKEARCFNLQSNSKSDAHSHINS